MAAHSFQLLSVEDCKTWEKSGKNELLNLCKGYAQEQLPWNVQKKKDLKRALYEICAHAVLGNVKLELAKSALEEIVELHKDGSSLLADVFALIGMG